MEEGETPPLEMITVEVEEEEAHATTSIPPMSPRNERSEKAPEGSTTLGGTWADMVKNNIVTPQGYSPERSPSQVSQETQEVDLQPTTRGRKSQRYLREQEAEREMELGRQTSLEEMKLLQKSKNQEEQEHTTDPEQDLKQVRNVENCLLELQGSGRLKQGRTNKGYNQI